MDTMTLIHLRSRVTALALGLAAALALSLGQMAPAFAAPAPQDQAAAAAPSEPQANQLYWSGHEALGKGDWSLALERFEQLEIDLREAQADGIDGALYWQAYALDAARRRGEASRIAERLDREFPDSRWRAEAGKFRSAAAGDSAGRERPQREGRDEREADALMALDALMVSHSNKALPTLERVLASDHSDKVKTRAMFVLSQIDPSAAGRALDAILANRTASSRLKREAVQQIAIGGDKRSLEKLVALYPQSEPDVRRAILNAYMMSGRADLLGQVARTETDPRNQRQAIQLLGASGDRDGLRALYRELKDDTSRRQALQALGVAGDSEGIGQILREARDAPSQRAALRALAISGGKDAREAIMNTWRQAADDGVRSAAVQALLVAGDGDGLLRLYREATDKKQKRELLQALTVTDSDRALEIIDEQL